MTVIIRCKDGSEYSMRYTYSILLTKSEGKIVYQLRRPVRPLTGELFEIFDDEIEELEIIDISEDVNY